MLSYQYTYLLMCLFLLVPWLAIFISRRDFRKMMLTMSGMFAVIGPIADFVYIQDWWKPETITGTPVGIESSFFGFVIAGVASTIYYTLFQKKLEPVSDNRIFNWKLWSTGFTTFMVFIGVFLLWRNSFLATILSQLIILSIIFFLRKDLIKPGLISGILTLFTIGIVYSLLEIITPGWVQKFWYFKNTPAIILLNVPIDDLVWYLLAGSSLGIYYEFWTNTRVIKSHS